MNELVVAASENHRQPHESPEEYANRIYQLSLQKAREAATFGKEVHDAIEHYPQLPLNSEVLPWINQFGTWFDANVGHALHREKILFDHDIGLAGRCDFIGVGRGPLDGRIILPDWKTQNVKKDDKGRKKPVFYESWPRQLAFYACSYAKETKTFPGLIPTCISVVIDSNEPETPFVKVWEPDEIRSSYEDVLIAAYRWFKRKKYFPQPAGLFKLGFNLEVPS